jgi:F-type H+-transporting ATPase subunit delta
MEELIAKRYIDALNSMVETSSFESYAKVFETLALEFKNEKFTAFINNPYIAKKEKETLLLDSVKSVESKEINNLISLLVEKNRIAVIPAIAEGMRKMMARSNKTYTGTVYSNSDINEESMKSISNGLSKKVDANVSLTFVKNDFAGIKVDVEDLGIEINFSKDRINSQLIEHILKAI